MRVTEETPHEWEEGERRMDRLWRLHGIATGFLIAAWVFYGLVMLVNLLTDLQ